MSDLLIIQSEKLNNSQQKNTGISGNGLAKLLVLNTGGSDILFAAAVRAFALCQT